MSDDPHLHATFIQLIETYEGALRRLCTAYSSAPADREDLFQEICLAVWRALPAFRGEASQRTWLYRIAHNVALTRQGRSRRRESREAPLEGDIHTTERTPLQQIALAAAIRAMKPADRTVVLLWLEGLSAAEIEAVTGVKAATVAMRLSRVRKQLSEQR